MKLHSFGSGEFIPYFCFTLYLYRVSQVGFSALGSLKGRDTEPSWLNEKKYNLHEGLLYQEFFFNSMVEALQAKNEN